MKYLFVAPSTNANTNVPNIGLASLAASLKELGNEVKVIDQETYRFPKDRFLSEKCDYFGVSVKSNTYYESQRITKLYRDKYPFSFIGWGGPQVTYCLNRCKENKEVNEFIVGNAEYLDGRKFDINKIPFPDYSSFDSFEYWKNQWQKGAKYPIVSSRGCSWGKCTFCCCGTGVHIRTADNVVKELEFAKDNYGIKTFNFMDDNVAVSKKRLLEICEGVKNLNLSWTCINGIRADCFDEDIAIKMKESGCFFVSFGIESSNNNVLTEINKGETIEEIESAVKIAKKYFRVNGYFIIGLPGSNYETDFESWNWSKKMGINSHFSILVPMEGTELYTKYRDNIINDPYESLFYKPDEVPIVSYETKEYPREERIKLYKTIRGLC